MNLTTKTMKLTQGQLDTLLPIIDFEGSETEIDASEIKSEYIALLSLTEIVE